MNLINNLTENLKEIFKERLVSLILYGSCVVDECDSEFSDINTIVVIDSLKATDLKDAEPAIKEFYKQKKAIFELLPEVFLQNTQPKHAKNPLPLFMDKDEWFNSCDVYPIEYSDIKSRYKILHGEDVVSPLVLEKSNLRLQCEYETKNLLIKLRQNYLANSHNPPEVEHLLKVIAKSFLDLFRGILHLTEETVPFGSRKVLDLLGEKVKINKSVFTKILELRSNPKAVSKNEYEVVIQKLIDSTDEIFKYVDKI